MVETADVVVVGGGVNGASTAYAQTTWPVWYAAPVPTTIGETAAGSVRGRAPSIHWDRVAMGASWVLGESGCWT